MKYTAIFGGTFNPPHIGHYEMAVELQKRPEIYEIWIMPTKIPPHKVCDFLADDSSRIEMCKLLAEDFSKAVVCLDEFMRAGKSYSYDTITLFKDKYRDKNFVFVCGGDMLATFDEWYKYDELMHMLPFYVFRRSDISDAEFDEKVEKFRNSGMDITVMDKKISHVSSTFIRNNLKNSDEIMPEKIKNYIKTEGIYGAGKL